MSVAADYRDRLEIQSDLRGDVGDVRDQQQRPVCIVFSISDVNRVFNQIDDHLSVEYLCFTSAQNQNGWTPECGFTYLSVSTALMHNGQPMEAEYPFQPEDIAAPLNLPPNFNEKYYPGEGTLLCENSPDLIRTQLTAGHVVTLVIGVTGGFQSPVEGFVNDEEVEEDEYPGVLHAVTCCGHSLSSETNQYFFLIKNSWGSYWADKGFCWVSETFIARHCKSIIVVKSDG